MGAAPARDLSYDTGVIPITPAPGREPGAGPRRTPRGPKLIPGASVAGGRYRLLTPHGGSRGLQFWQALDVKLDREVALTFVDAEQRSTSAGPEGPQAILSRTLRLGRINSPGLARVLDVVRGSSGGIVVAEWTPGRSLREMADTKPSPIGAASAIRALAAAAETAHRAGGALSIDHPDRVRISINGDAVLAFPATLADSDSSTDVRGLGAMLYALITARWPLGDPSAPAGDPSGPHRPGSVGGMRLADRDSSGQPDRAAGASGPEVPFEISAVALRSLEPNGGIRTAATVQHMLDQASVVDEKTDLIPALRLGQRAPGATGHALADPEALEAEKKKSNRMIARARGPRGRHDHRAGAPGLLAGDVPHGQQLRRAAHRTGLRAHHVGRGPARPPIPAPAPAPAANVAPVSPAGAAGVLAAGHPRHGRERRAGRRRQHVHRVEHRLVLPAVPRAEERCGPDGHAGRAGDTVERVDQLADTGHQRRDPQRPVGEPDPRPDAGDRFEGPRQRCHRDPGEVGGTHQERPGVDHRPDNSGGKNQSSIADIGFNAAT